MKIIVPIKGANFIKGAVDNKYRSLFIPYTETLQATAEYGDIVLQSFRSENNFEMGHNFSFTNRPVELKVRFEHPVLMLSYILDGQVTYLDKGLTGETAVSSGRYHLCYENKAEHPLNLGQGYLENFHISLSARYLSSLQMASPVLNPFIEAVCTGSNQPLHTPYYKVTARMRRIVREITGYRGNFPALFIEGRITELLHLFLESVVRQDLADIVLSTEQRDIASVATFIETNLQEPISVATLAKTFAFSESELHRRFRQAYGVSIYQHILELRMLKARTLLTGDTYYTVSEIATRCGYEDAANFSNAFKRRFGHTTSYYRAVGRTINAQESTSKIFAEINKPERKATSSFEPGRKMRR